MKNKEEKKIRKVGIILLLIALLLGICFIGVYIYERSKETKIPSVDNLIREKKKKQYKDKDENQIDVQSYENILPSVRAQYGNENIVGKLEIPNIGINAYVARSDNNAFYLNYNYYNQYDALGVPFFDYRNVDLANDKQINIYGHNTRNEKYYDQLPFINLEAYVDENIFKNYKDVYLSIDEKQVHYKVIATKIVDDSDNEHMKVIFHDKPDFLTHSMRLLQNTMYKDSNLEITSSDRLLVLQVCHYNPPNTYLLIICKEVKA